MRDLWRKLYSSADRIHALAPWRWMDDGELLGVQDPVTGEIGFIHVLGQAGEHFGISRYPGEEGLGVLKSLQEGDIDDPSQGADILLSSHQIQLSWEDSRELDRRDKLPIKELGLKYRGSKAWPQFRSYEPSLYPWYLTEEQAATFLTALEQSIEVFERRQNDASLFHGLEQNHYLVRVLSDGKWRDEIKEALPSFAKVSVVGKIPSLPRLKALPGRKGCIEIDLIRTPAVGGDGPNDRPFLPHMLMLVNGTTGIVLPGFELLQPFPSQNAMYGNVAEKVCSLLLQVKIVPAEIRVRKKLMKEILSPLADELGLRVTLHQHLPKFEEATSSLMSFFRAR